MKSIHKIEFPFIRNKTEVNMQKKDTPRKTEYILGEGKLNMQKVRV